MTKVCIIYFKPQEPFKNGFTASIVIDTTTYSIIDEFSITIFENKFLNNKTALKYLQKFLMSYSNSIFLLIDESNCLEEEIFQNKLKTNLKFNFREEYKRFFGKEFTPQISNYNNYGVELCHIASELCLKLSTNNFYTKMNFLNSLV